MGKQRFWEFRAAANNPKVGELLLYGVISSESWWGDEVTPKQFKQDLDALGALDELHVFINSDGGDMFAGQAIHSMLKRHSAKVIVHIDGLAASIASVIAMAGERVLMPRNAMMMIHNPWTWAVGNAEEFRKLADDMDKMRASLVAAYEDKSGMEPAKIIELLDAETWMTAEEAVAYGFADEIETTKEVAASAAGGRLTVNGRSFDLSRFRNRPKLAATSTAPADPTSPEAEPGEPESGPAYDVGERVQVIGIPHLEGQQAGEVREAVLTYVYGVQFDGSETIYHWYVESELQEDPAADNVAARRSTAGRKPVAGNRPTTPSPVEPRFARLSLYERRLKTNER